MPKTSHAVDYYYELSYESSKYMKEKRQSQGYYGFADIVEGAAIAYSTMYQEIVEGHRNGTREVYVLENTENENNINIKDLVSSILQRSKGNLYHYCELLFRNISNPL